MTTPAQTTVFLGEFETKSVIDLGLLAPGTYYYKLMVRCNSLLSSVFLQACPGGATVKANYFDTTTGDETTPERYDLTGHDLLGPADVGKTNRILVTKIHNKPQLELIITGSAVNVGVYVTAVSTSASDIDSALKEDGTVAVLASDRGLPAMGLGDDGQYHFLPIEGGALKITGTVSTSQLVGGKARAVVIAAPGVEQAHVFAAGTRKFMLKARTPGKILLSFAAGDIAAGDYISIHPGAFYLSEEFIPSAKTIYFQSGIGGLVVELESWS